MRISAVAIAAAISLFGVLQLSDTFAANTKQEQASLHRADFRVEGASCVTCLRRVAKAMRETKGVLKADVSIYKPYWAIVIYDSKTTTFDKISAVTKTEKVKFTGLEDKALAEMPLIVIPKISSPAAHRSAAH